MAGVFWMKSVALCFFSVDHLIIIITNEKWEEKKKSDSSEYLQKTQTQIKWHREFKQSPNMGQCHYYYHNIKGLSNYLEDSLFNV